MGKTIKMLTAKELIKVRSLKFLHPDVVERSDDANVAQILKAVGYFRNLPIFKMMYSILNKSSSLSLDQYHTIYNIMKDYKKHHPADFFIDGFSAALVKSNVNSEVKTSYAILIYNRLYKDGLFNEYVPRNSKRIEKAIDDYYLDYRHIKLAVIKKSKVKIINNENIIKMITKMSVKK